MRPISGTDRRRCSCCTPAASRPAWGVWRKTRSNLAAALAAALYLWVDWRQLAIARPQLAGCVCFMLLFVLARTIRRVALPIPRLRVGKNGGYELTASLVESKFPFRLT